MVLTFDENEIMILNDICDIQIQSYNLILEEKLLEEDKILLQQFQVPLEKAYREAHWRISEYRNIIESPNYIGIMDESEISTMRHILFHIEENYIVEYPDSIRSLWEKFFTIEEYRNKNILLSLTLNKIIKDGKEK